MKSRVIAKLLCLAIGAAVGWAIFINLSELFAGWIPPAATVIAFVLVFVLLYFPLVRPVAEVIADRLSVLAHRGRNIRAGSGLDSIPEAKRIPCSICGGPGGPICNSCNKEMEKR